MALDEFFNSLTPILEHAFPDAPIAKIQREFRLGLKAIQEHLMDNGYYDNHGFVTCWLSGYTKPQYVTMTLFQSNGISRT
jgi:hypothetical protein